MVARVEEAGDTIDLQIDLQYERVGPYLLGEEAWDVLLPAHSTALGRSL